MLPGLVSAARPAGRGQDRRTKGKSSDGWAGSPAEILQTRRHSGSLATTMTGRLRVVAVSLAHANAFVDGHHRHHRPVVGHKFSLGVTDVDEELRAVAIVGRPVARARDDGLTLEVTRLASDGCSNACSALYGAAWRATKALGYSRIGTYTLASEPGVSLRAAGWHVVHEVRGRSWDVPSRRRHDRHPTADKRLWEPVEVGAPCVASPGVTEEVERMARQLAGAATRASEATKQRDLLIGELYVAGMGLREIARHAGLSHPAVRRTLVRDGHIPPTPP
jgi:hypothetical protein